MDRVATASPSRIGAAGEKDEQSRAIAAWLERLIAGDTDAATWLYDTFAPALFRRIRGRYGRAGTLDPRELLQDAFLFFLQNECKVLRDFTKRWRAEEQTPRRLEGHLWDLACGLASNRRRAARRRPRIESIDRVAERGVVVLEKRAGAEQQLLDRDLIQRLEQCLEGKDEFVYLYFKLRYADGLSPREISTVTGWPIKTVYRFRESLDRTMADCLATMKVEVR